MQGEKQYKTGLDVGSTTAKIVIIDESGQTVFSRYERHNAQVNDLLSAYFREARQELGDIETSIAVTGSVGMGTAEQLRTEFIQEVVAATRYAQQLYPSASALIAIYPVGIGAQCEVSCANSYRCAESFLHRFFSVFIADQFVPVYHHRQFCPFSGL